MTAPLLEARGITKRFPGVTALDRVSFQIHSGEVLALIGENGAGKSTLMKVLGGVHQPDEGSVFINGQQTKILSVSDSIRHGIGFVHQELNVLDNIDIAGNIFLGREPLGCGPLKLIQKRKMQDDARPWLERLGLNLHPGKLLGQLTIGQQQLVEIAKALSQKARVIIMDEPTSSLTMTETDRLMTIVNELKEQNISIIYISHRLGEIKQCATRVVALRDGKNAGELAREDIHHDAMVSLMVGRDLKNMYEKDKKAKISKNYFCVDQLSTAAWPNQRVSFSVGKGEILGFAGLVGSGRSELMQSIFGVDEALSGQLKLDSKTIPLNSTKSCIANGIYLAPEDRKATGLILEMNLRENISLASLNRTAKMMMVNRQSEKTIANEQIKALKIKTHSTEIPAGSLSGGNQQKVVLAKWLSMSPKVIIFDEPTRGIDVGARNEIYTLMNELACRGVAIIMVSSDMEEVLGVSDRIAVMHEGAISGFLTSDQFSEEAIMQLAVSDCHTEEVK